MTVQVTNFESSLIMVPADWEDDVYASMICDDGSGQVRSVGLTGSFPADIRCCQRSCMAVSRRCADLNVRVTHRVRTREQSVRMMKQPVSLRNTCRQIREGIASNPSAPDWQPVTSELVCVDIV